MSSSWTERPPGDGSSGNEAARPASPCVRNCCLDEQDICMGCGRSLNEILEWSAADDPRRRAICAVAGSRLAARRPQP